MSEIVYYDENPTVRALMVRTLTRFGFHVVQMPGLSQCEDTLRQCKHPVALIVDLSRSPSQLPRLQAIVPRYLPNPEQCILTSTRPTDLARFLPDQVDSCFFRHVVERPFKRLDFARFIENIIRPSTVASLLNSSVSQIIGDLDPDSDDHSFIDQADEIIHRSQSVTLDKIMLAAGLDSKHITGSHDEVGSASKSSHEADSTGSSVTMAASGSSSSGVASVARSQAGNSAAQPAVNSALAASSTILPIATFSMGLKPFLAVIEDTTIRNSRQTVVCRDLPLTHVIILEAGRIQWYEAIQYDTILDENQFFSHTPYANILPAMEILGLMQQGYSMASAISTLNADELSMEFCEHIAAEAVKRIYSLEGKMVEVYRNIPAPWDALMAKRPIQGIDLVPMLFELCRQYEDSVIVPDFFRYSNFTMRPYRTPVNRTIQLSREESDLLIAVQNPRTLSDLKRSRIKGAADMLYRLVLFGFVDLVG